MFQASPVRSVTASQGPRVGRGVPQGLPSAPKADTARFPHKELVILGATLTVATSPGQEK